MSGIDLFGDVPPAAQQGGAGLFDDVQPAQQAEPSLGDRLYSDLIEPAVRGNRVAAGFLSHLAGNAADLVSKIGPVPGAEAVRDYFRGGEAAMQNAPLPNQPLGAKITEGLVAGAGELPAYIGGAELLGPTAGMGAVGALANADQGVVPAIEGGAKAALMGKLAEVTAPLTTPARIGVNAAVGGGEAALTGASPSDIIANAVVQGGMGAIPTGGNVSARDLVTGRARAPEAEPPVLPAAKIAAMGREAPYEPPPATPQAQAVLEANNVKPPERGASTEAELGYERLLQEAEQRLGATKPEQPLTTKADQAEADQRLAEVTARQPEQVAVAPAELTTEQLAAARDRGEQPAPAQAPEVISVGPEVRAGGGAAPETTARVVEPDLGTQAGMARARGDDLSARIGEDAGALVHQQLGVPTDTFATLPGDARERLVAAAQRQRSVAAPEAATLRVSDTSGEGPTSPASAPQRGAGAAGRGIQPTETEIAASGEPRAATATGTNDRPFKAEATDGATPEQAAGFEDRARAQAADARQASQDDLERQWAERRTSRQQSGADPFADARQQYQGGANFSPKTAPLGEDGRFAVDKFGFVASDKGGPVRFADQKQAAKWIVNVGHKQSADQVFEIENHPSGKGFSVRERGRAEQAGDTGQGARPSAGPEASASAASPQRALPGPKQEESGGDNGDRSGTRPGENRGRVDKGRDAGGVERDQQSDDMGRAGSGAAEAVGARSAEHGPGGRASSDQVSAGAGEASRSTGTTEPARAPKAGEQKASTAEGVSEAPPVEEATKQASDAADKAGPKFYSNPLDPGLIKDVFTPIMRGVGRWAAHEWDAWQGEMHQFKDALMASSAMHPARAAVDAVKMLWYSNDGVIRSIANRFKEADGKPNTAITEIANKFFAPPGRADTGGVGRTYGEAVEIHHDQQRNRLAKVLEPLRTLPRERQQMMLDKLGNMLRNDNLVAGRSQLDDIGVKIRQQLRDELAYLREAGVDIGEVKGGYLPRELDTSKVFSDTAKFVADATSLYKTEGATAKEADDLAEAWLNRLREGDLGFHVDGNDFLKFGSAGTGTRFEKSRTLGKKADEMMADWYIANPAELLPHYFLRAARRAEWTRIMGADMGKWADFKERMKATGVDADGLAQLVGAIQSATGTLGSPTVGAGRAMLGLARNWSAFTYLTRATYSSLTEPILAGVRTGNALDALNSYGLTIKDILGQVRRGVGGDGGKSLARDLAEDLGLISRVGDQMLMAQRFGTDMPGQLARSWADRFFSKTGLTQWTDATRVSSTRIGQVFMRRLASDIANGSMREKSARFLLGELGVKAEDAADFAGWVKANGDGIPDIDALSAGGKHAEIYKTALNRFLNQVILRPKAIEKPKWASHPLGSLFYGLQSYNYSFQKNVLARVGNTTKAAFDPKTDLGAFDRMRLMAPLAMLPVLVGAQYGLNELRKIIWQDPGKPQPKQDETEQDRLLTALSRSNMFGSLDLPANMVANMRYQREPATVMLGPLIGGVSELFSAGVGLTSKNNSPNTNAAERKAARFAYSTFIQPALVGALSLAPGTTGTILGGLGIQLAASPQVREGFVAPMAGPVSSGGGGGRGTGRAGGRSAGR